MSHLSFAPTRLDFRKDKSLVGCILFGVILDWIWCLISSFSRSEHLYIGPFGKGAPGIKSIECFTWQCKGSLVGEVNMSLYSSMIVSTCFYCVAGLSAEVVDMSTIFFSLWERTMKRINFPVCVMTFALFGWDQRDGSLWGYLWNPVESFIRSNDDTMRSRIIYNMLFPHIWLA